MKLKITKKVPTILQPLFLSVKKKLLQLLCNINRYRLINVYKFGRVANLQKPVDPNKLYFKYYRYFDSSYR